MKCCHDPPCPTNKKVKRMPLLSRNLEAGIWHRRLLPGVPGEMLMCQDEREHIPNSEVPASCGMGHTKMKALLGLQFQLPFDSIISQVNFSSWLEGNPGFPTPARSKAAWSPVAGRQVNACDSSGGLAAVSHQLTEKKCLKLLWEDPMGLGYWVGTASSFLLTGKGNIVQETWLRKESLTLARCVIFLSLQSPSTSYSLWCLVAGQR